ncbi:MAG: AAA family ATPase [Xanthobacteraceae bacterium]|nr:AAA family ATPase [Xanthobacteraceae bacterium]
MEMSEWMKLVSEVFDTNPRNGNKGTTVWLGRPKIEAQLEAELFTRGRHICVDGCSGAGKSSLIITLLLRHDIKYTTVQVTRTMDWEGFCRNVISKAKRASTEVRASASAEWKAIFPTGRLELGLSRKSDGHLDHDLWEKTVKSASQHDIARAMSEQNCVLLIDEFERAQPELATRISEVCKILSQTYPSEFGKIVILGADDVYKKLYDVYSTLDNRLVQISIPTLPSPTQSWQYLKRGFEKLGKFHPGNSRFSKHSDAADSMAAIYYAADGLFKTLTELGIEICRTAGPNIRGITKSHIQQACKAMEERNFSKYRAKFSQLHMLARAQPMIVPLLRYLNDHGLGQVHDRAKIQEALSSEFGYSMIEDAVLTLWKEDMIVITGESNQTIFMKNPTWAHTLRVYLSDPRKLQKLEQHLAESIQLMLPFSIDWASLQTEAAEPELSADQGLR